MKGIQPTDKETIIRVINLKLKEYPDYDGSFTVVDVVDNKFRISSQEPPSSKTLEILHRVEEDLEIRFL